jgi:hypothetical protein
VALVLTFTLSFKDLCYSKTKVFLPFKHVKAQCLEVPWFSFIMATPL